MITCAFCDRVYRAGDCEDTCDGCALVAGCGKSRCPYCGYQNQKPLAGRKGFWEALMGREGKGNASPE